MAETYAIVESGGKQYRAEKGTVLVVDRLPADEGDKVALRPVMYRGGKEVVLDGGGLEKVKVEAMVTEHLRGDKLRVFKYRPKKGYRRRAGHRSELTRLEVTDVRMLSRKPASKPKAGAKAKVPGSGKESPKGKKGGAPKKGAGKGSTKGTTARKSSGTRKASQKKET
jgi:large subunit ribosomal protein L21